MKKRLDKVFEVHYRNGGIITLDDRPNHGHSGVTPKQYNVNNVNGVNMAGFPKPGINKTGDKAKRPHAGIPLDKKVITDLIVRHTGNVSRIADAIGSCRGSVSAFINRDPELIAALKQARERQLDELEASVFDRAIESNDTTLQLFLLKTQGKTRGYEQSEAQNAAKDIATAAFDFIVNKSKNPAERGVE